MAWQYARQRRKKILIRTTSYRGNEVNRSADRILTTHAGSLPRPAGLVKLLYERERDTTPFDEQAYRQRCRVAVADIVRKQAEYGIDIVDDGEMGKPSFISYVQERLSGFELSETGLGVEGPGGAGRLQSRETQSFPEFYEWMSTQNRSGPSIGMVQMECTGPVTYRGHRDVQADIENLKLALADVDVEQAFLPAIAPSDIEARQKNRYYASQEEYLFAIADAMREEYKAIVDAGFILQIDDPLLLTHYVKNPQLSLDECLTWASTRVEALNYALRDVPSERVRFHTCYGINMGPRIHDLELKDVVGLILRVNAGAYSFEAANPRHEHEWRIWEIVKLPKEKILIPGVITHTSYLVEHPDLIADRIERFASVVGRENVIAGSDCGFSTFAGASEIHPTVVWAKFAALREGARIASARLWKMSGAGQRRVRSA